MFWTPMLPPVQLLPKLQLLLHLPLNNLSKRLHQFRLKLLSLRLPLRQLLLLLSNLLLLHLLEAILLKLQLKRLPRAFKVLEPRQELR